MRCCRPPSGALQLCSCVWFCGLASWGLPQSSQGWPPHLYPAWASLQALPCEGEVSGGEWGGCRGPLNSIPLFSFQGSWELWPSAPTEGPGVCRGRHPEVAERRGNKRNGLNCTPTPLVRGCVVKGNKGEGGGDTSQPFPCRLPRSVLFLTWILAALPLAAQCSPTRAFLFHNTCQKTRYSAPNMELARGQGLAADRLPNHLAGTMASSP